MFRTDDFCEVVHSLIRLKDTVINICISNDVSRTPKMRSEHFRFGVLEIEQNDIHVTEVLRGSNNAWYANLRVVHTVHFNQIEKTQKNSLFGVALTTIAGGNVWRVMFWTVKGQRQSSRLPMSSGVKINNEDIRAAFATTSNNTATSLDQMPGSILKILKTCPTIRKMVDYLWSRKQTRSGKVYEPTTVATVLHPLFRKVLCRRIKYWIEHNNVMGELQAGFKQGRKR